MFEEKKNVSYIPISSAAEQSLVNGGSEYKVPILFPVRLYSFSPRSDALSQNLLSERKIKHPIIIRARHRRARISKCRLYLFIGVSRYLRVPGFGSFLPKSTSHGLGVGRQESNAPLLPPLYCREKIRSLVLRSMPPHKLRLLTSPES